MRHVALLVTVAALTLAVPQTFAGKPGTAGGTASCKGKKCDTLAPTVSISDPSAGQTLSGAASMNGSASDNGEVVGVKFSVDGGSSLDAAGTTSWSSVLDTTHVTDGSHLITVTATDLAGNVGAASVTVSVSNVSQPAPQTTDPTPQPPPPPPPSTATPVAAPPLGPGSIGGYVFQEGDRDGVYETDEQPLSAQHLFLFDAQGAYLQNAYSDSTGWYSFSGLPDGRYRVEFAPADWWAIRHDWVPDTTPSTTPELDVDLPGSNRADFGWRPIVRSSDASSPISSYLGPNGLTVRSYDDVVAAKSIYDRLLQGLLIGAEASHVTVRFDFAATGSTSTMAARSNGGPYDQFTATSDVSYLSWLDGDNELFHEYGHAWSLYFAYIVQQDPTMRAYLAARGLTGDVRLNSSYGWSVRELIAEDYRQLFGTPSAQAAAQMNREISPAADVVGLKSFLATGFTAQPPPA